MKITTGIRKVTVMNEDAYRWALGSLLCAALALVIVPGVFAPLGVAAGTLAVWKCGRRWGSWSGRRLRQRCCWGSWSLFGGLRAHVIAANQTVSQSANGSVRVGRASVQRPILSIGTNRGPKTTLC